MYVGGYAGSWTTNLFGTILWFSRLHEADTNPDLRGNLVDELYREQYKTWGWNENLVEASQ